MTKMTPRAPLTTNLSSAPAGIPAGISAPVGPMGPGMGQGMGQGTKQKVTKTSAEGTVYVDWKDVDTLRRCMSPNGKIHGRKRVGATASEQRLLGQAIKRARFMALLPYTSATL